MSLVVLNIAFVLLYCALLVPAASARANGSDNNDRKAYVVQVRAIQDPPLLDGILSVGEWQKAAIIENFTQKEPKEGAPASESTVVLISHDSNYIYFGVRCYDRDPSRIVANEMRRDHDLSENDYFEILIDTYRDRRNALYFATNPVGARLDCEVKAEGDHINWNWDGVWHSVARRDSLGWTAEIAIPFQTLRFRKNDQLSWGINFGRYIARKREEQYWSPITRNDDFDDTGKYKPSRFGLLQGLQNIRQRRHVELKPYSIGGLEKDSEPGGNTRIADAGIDAKLHLTSNLTADLTYNTDFAQVEADAEQVNISRFSLFFPEKRDFFLEGLDVFNIGDGSASSPFALLFFSRRIGLDGENGTRETPVIGGAKLTGKLGSYDIGVLDVYTDDISNDTGSGLASTPETNFSAFRLKRDIFKRSSVGVMALSKDPRSGTHNRTFAADASLAFQNASVSGYVAKTQTPGVRGNDFNTHIKASWGTDRYYAFGSFTDVGGNFNPEMGFLQWQDVRKYNLYLSYSPRPELLNIRQTHFQYQIEYITDHNEELQYRTIQPSIYNIFKDQSYVFLGLINYYDNAPGFSIGKPENPAQVPAGIYRYNVLGLTYASDQSRLFAGSLRIGYGSFYDGTFLGITGGSAWRPSRKFGVDLSWQWNRVDLPFANGLFGGNLVRAKFKYSFSPDLFIRTDLQWNELNNRFTSKILFNYIPKAGSDLYLVYSDLWQTDPVIATANRAVVAKLTYLFDF